MAKIMSIGDLRGVLTDEIDKLREGKTTPANANAVTNAAGKILSSVKLEMEYHKLVGKSPQIDFIALPEPRKVKPKK